MEQVLGRYLLPEESVHHRNGVRDDNRPENLELWTRPQPIGIRACDAVAWAREVLARYEGELNLLGPTEPPFASPDMRTRRAAEPSARSATGTPKTIQVFEKS